MQTPEHSRWPQLGALNELLLLMWRPATEGKIHGAWPTGRGSARGCCSSHHPSLHDCNCCSCRLAWPCPARSSAPAPAGGLCLHAYSHSCGTPCRPYTVRVLHLEVQQPGRGAFRLHVRGITPSAQPFRWHIMGITPPWRGQLDHASAAAALVRGPHPLKGMTRALQAAA